MNTKTAVVLGSVLITLSVIAACTLSLIAILATAVITGNVSHA